MQFCRTGQRDAGDLWFSGHGARIIGMGFGMGKPGVVVGNARIIATARLLPREGAG
jgi:hypothetical protein